MTDSAETVSISQPLPLLRSCSKFRLRELMRDIALLLLNSTVVVVIAVVARHRTTFSLSGFLQPDEVRSMIAALFLYGAIIVLACCNFGLYESRPLWETRDHLWAVWKASLVATVLVGFWWLSQSSTLLGVALSCAAVLNVTAFSWFRVCEREEVVEDAAQERRRVLIIGAGRLGQRLATALSQPPGQHYTVCGFLDDRIYGPKVLGRLADLSTIAHAHFVDEVIIALPSNQRELVKNVAADARANRLDVYLLPDVYDLFLDTTSVGVIANIPVLQIHQEPIPAVALAVKRVMDVIVASVGLIVAAPLFFLIAIAIKLDSKGPVFYCSTRVGKKGRRFRFYKFRTMVVNADGLKDALRARNKREGPFFKVVNDPRITRVGKYLRKSSLDELPQLWNVLNSDMSLVGPRPHPEDDFQRYRLEHFERLDVKPGLTGLWQVTARQDPSFETSMRLDLEYIEHWTPWIDLKILLFTLPAVFLGNGE